MRIRSMTLLAAAVAVAGCGGDSNAPAPTDHVGLYALESLDGAAPPITLADFTDYVVVLSEGSVMLAPTNQFVTSFTLEEKSSGVTTTSTVFACAGTYRRAGNTITMTTRETADCSAGTVAATLDGHALTVNDQGSVMVFRR